MLAELLDEALANGDDGRLRQALEAGVAVEAFAAAVGQVVDRADPPVERLEALLDGWAALGGDGPEVVLSCAAVAAYGEVGAVRPDWLGDEVAKLRRAATDPRRQVRDLAAEALRRLLGAEEPPA